MMIRLQQWIHTMEEGRGATVIKVTLAVVLFFVLAALYDYRAYKNFTAPEAMDAAQVGRNLAEGRGYTTWFIRPLSVALVRDHSDDRNPRVADHPDLANAPVYPTVLATVFKVLPLSFEIPLRGAAPRFRPEVMIAVLNQMLFFTAALLMYFLAKRLFDRELAWVAVLGFVGAELFWRFSASGLSTMLLLNLFLLLVTALVRLDEEQKKQAPSDGKILGWSVACGVFLGLAALTRYSFTFMLIPVLLYAAMLAPRFKVKTAVTMAVTFLVLMSPWIVRNFVVSGSAFGTASYALCEGTRALPGDTLQRTLNPDAALNDVEAFDFVRKIFVNTREIFQNDLPKMGGSWLSAFFLVSIMLPFKNPTLSRLRLFLVAALVVFVLVQAGGRTNLSETTPDVNTENLLAIFAPLVFIYGTAMFFVLLDRLDVQFLFVRQTIIGLLLVLLWLPLVSILMQRTNPFAYPPYFPPLVQQIGRMVHPQEMIMSDIPAAVAWYGNRRSASLTLDYSKDFQQFNQQVQPVAGLYFRPVTMDSHFMGDMLRPTVQKKDVWPRFVWEALTRGEGPEGFPLKKAWLDILPDHLFFAATEPWKVPVGQ